MKELLRLRRNTEWFNVRWKIHRQTFIHPVKGWEQTEAIFTDGGSTAYALFTAHEKWWGGRINATGQELLSNLRWSWQTEGQSDPVGAVLGVFCCLNDCKFLPDTDGSERSENLCPFRKHFLYFLVWKPISFSLKYSPKKDHVVTSGRLFIICCLLILRHTGWWMRFCPVRAGSHWSFHLLQQNLLPSFISLFFPVRRLSPVPSFFSFFRLCPALKAQHVFPPCRSLCHLKFFLFHFSFRHSANASIQTD